MSASRRVASGGKLGEIIARKNSGAPERVTPMDFDYTDHAPASDHIYLSDLDYAILNRIALQSFLAKTRKWLVESALVFVNSFDDSLIIETLTLDIELIEEHSKQIAEAAYMKLGCMEVRVCCMKKHLKTYSFLDLDYNEFQEDECAEDSAMPTATLDRTINVVEDLQPVSSANWISFQQVAQIMGIQESEVEAMARTQGVPHTRNSAGQWGFTRTQAEDFSTTYYSVQNAKAKAQIQVMPASGLQSAPSIEPDEFAESVSSIAAASTNGSNPSPALQMEEGETNGSSGTESKQKRMQFPRKDFAPVRQGSDGKTKHYLTLQKVLPRVTTTAKNYLERIINGTADASFMKSLLGCYPSDKKQQENFLAAAQQLLQDMQTAG